MRRILFCLLSLTLLLSACARPSAPAGPEANARASRTLEAMDTFMTLTACGAHREDALDAAEAEIRRLEALFSIGSPDSEVSALNRAGEGVLSEDGRAVVSRALELHADTGGRFDITVLPLMELWGFTSGKYRVPSDGELAEILPAVGADLLDYDPETGKLALCAGQAIDLGGIAKGYASQRVMELYRAAGVTSGLVSLGGNVQCLGARPDGSPWRIGIQDPEGVSGAMAAVVEVVDQAVITSGGYERYFVDEATGVNYRHILDPETGTPAESDLTSVTIVSPDGMLADGLSTALYIMGLEAAVDYWRAHSDAFQAIFIDASGQIHVTEGLAPSVSPAPGGAEFDVLKA